MVNMVICGLGYISKRVADGCNFSNKMNLYGCLSSDEAKSLRFKEKHHVAKIFNTYQEIYNDDKVDLLYLCTPNFTHYDLIKQSLENHKSVICEKPMVDSSEKIKELFNLARLNNCFLMEAEKTIFNPLNIKIKQMIKDNIIGDIYHIEAKYYYDIRKLNLHKDNWNFSVGGGCSGDVGVYPVSFSHYIADSSIKDIKIVKHGYAGYNVDFYYEALITYESGVTSNVKSSWLQDIPNKGSAYIYGEKGYIEIPSYWKGDKAIIHLDEFDKVIKVDFESDFLGEIDHAAEMIMQHKCESDILDELMSLEILKAIKE